MIANILLYVGLTFMAVWGAVFLSMWMISIPMKRQSALMIDLLRMIAREMVEARNEMEDKRQIRDTGD